MSGRKPPRVLTPQPVVPRPRKEQPPARQHPVVPHPRKEQPVPQHPVVPRPRTEQATATKVVDPPPTPVEAAPEARNGRPREDWPDPWTRDSQRRNLWARILAIVGVVVGLVVLAAVSVFLIRSGDPAVTDDRVRPLARVPAAPVALAAQTSWIDARITPSGIVRVRHWIRSDADLFSVGLSLPPKIRALAGSPPVRVRDVLVVADGRAVPGPEWLRSGRGTYAFHDGSTEVFIRYRLEGAVERSGSVPGRALARLLAVAVDLTEPLRTTTYAVSGGQVLTLACSAPQAGSVPVPCGSPTDGGPADSGWQVRLPESDRDTVVTAQLDMP